MVQGRTGSAESPMKTYSPTEMIGAVSRLHSMTLDELAWLMHEAERYEDDILVMEITDAADKRYFRADFAEAYRRLWPEHARACGYGK